MKNIEFYKNEIAEMIEDCKKISKNECDICNNKEVCDQLFSKKQIVKWFFEEHKPKITDDEKVILRNIKPDYKYIARDKDGDIYAYQIKPSKNNETWVNGRFHINIRAFNHLFQFIKWEDEEPYNIEELLKEVE